MAKHLSQWTLGAVCALALLAGLWVARESGLGLAKVTTALPMAGASAKPHAGDCAFEFAGHYLVDDVYTPGYTITCWDADGYLSVPAPVAHR